MKALLLKQNVHTNQWCKIFNQWCKILWWKPVKKWWVDTEEEGEEGKCIQKAVMIIMIVKKEINEIIK